MERPAINRHVLVDDAHTADPTKKVATATRRMTFRPQISESLAHTGIAAALARR
jgi:hypothetical protein